MTKDQLDAIKDILKVIDNCEYKTGTTPAFAIQLSRILQTFGVTLKALNDELSGVIKPADNKTKLDNTKG